MPKCKRHGYYDENYDAVGVGCPKCYEEDERKAFDDAFREDTTCELCGKSLPLIHEPDDQSYYHRVIIHEEMGYPEGDWDDPHNSRHICCPECAKQKIEPLFNKSREKNNQKDVK